MRLKVGAILLAIASIGAAVFRPEALGKLVGAEPAFTIDGLSSAGATRDTLHMVAVASRPLSVTATIKLSCARRPVSLPSVSARIGGELLAGVARFGPKIPGKDCVRLVLFQSDGRKRFNFRWTLTDTLEVWARVHGESLALSGWEIADSLSASRVTSDGQAMQTGLRWFAFGGFVCTIALAVGALVRGWGAQAERSVGILDVLISRVRGADEEESDLMQSALAHWCSDGWDDEKIVQDLTKRHGVSGRVHAQRIFAQARGILSRLAASEWRSIVDKLREAEAQAPSESDAKHL